MVVVNLQEENKIIIDESFVKEYSSNGEVIRFMQSKFKRLSTNSAVNLTKMIIWKQVPINASQIITSFKTFCRYNLSKFDKNNNLKIDVIKLLRMELNDFLISVGKEIIEYDEKIHDKVIIDKKTGNRCFILEKNTLYEKVVKLMCNELGNIYFKYDFNNPDLEITRPKNKSTLQRCNVQILGNNVKFHYPVEYEYNCYKCDTNIKYKAYKVVCTKTRIKCSGFNTYIGADGSSKSRQCTTTLTPHDDSSTSANAYYYNISYEDEYGDNISAETFSYNKYSPGFYECVMFRINNPKGGEMFQIVDVKEIKNNIFDVPEHKQGENYFFTLQKAIDKFIKKTTGMEIYGLYPMKVAMIIQKMFNILGLKLSANIQLVGDASTGKTLVLKYYGFMINQHLNMTTNGLCCSVPGLRGTKCSIILMGKEHKIVTVGQLGTFHTIHIDEAGENKDLITNLKSFLFEENYSYDKAGSEGVFRKRTTHVNLSENLNYVHLGQYRGSIRKAYKELNVKIGDDYIPEWDENYDLHLPIFKYDNLYLRKVIKDKRDQYQQKQTFWIDGYDYALHSRFPFYFYLVDNKKNNKVLSDVVKGNVSRNPIEENLELIKALKNSELNEFFDTTKKYLNSKSEVEELKKVDTVLESYGLNVDTRTKNFYYNLVKTSRVINKRMNVTDDDLDLLKWMLEKTQCKLDINDTANYEIIGPPDIKKVKEIEDKIEDETKDCDTAFGLPKDDEEKFGKF